MSSQNESSPRGGLQSLVSAEQDPVCFGFTLAHCVV